MLNFFTSVPDYNAIMDTRRAVCCSSLLQQRYKHLGSASDSFVNISAVQDEVTFHKVSVWTSVHCVEKPFGNGINASRDISRSRWTSCSLSAVTQTNTWRPVSFSLSFLSLSLKLCLSLCTCFFPDTRTSKHTQQIMLSLSFSLYLIDDRSTLPMNPITLQLIEIYLIFLTTNDPISL